LGHLVPKAKLLTGYSDMLVTNTSTLCKASTFTNAVTRGSAILRERIILASLGVYLVICLYPSHVDPAMSEQAPGTLIEASLASFKYPLKIVEHIGTPYVCSAYWWGGE
jgi:hypothetical protein